MRFLVAMAFALAAACDGESSDPAPDAGAASDDADPSAPDAGMTNGTLVTGVFEDGSAFELRYSNLTCGATTNELLLLSVPYGGMTEETYYTLHLEFRDVEGEYEVRVPFTFLSKIPDNEVEPALSGWIDIWSFDPDACEVEADLSVAFSQGPTSGHAVAP